MKKVPFDIAYFRAHHPLLETRNGVRAEFVRMDPDETKTYPLTIAVHHQKYTYTEDGHTWGPRALSPFDVFMLVDNPMEWRHFRTDKPDDLQLVCLKGSECVWQYMAAWKKLVNLVTSIEIPEEIVDCYIAIPVYDLKKINYERKRIL